MAVSSRRAVGLRSGLPVIHMAGYSELDSQDMSKAANACRLLHKPFSVSALTH